MIGRAHVLPYTVHLWCVKIYRRLRFDLTQRRSIKHAQAQSKRGGRKREGRREAEEEMVSVTLVAAFAIVAYLTLFTAPTTAFNRYTVGGRNMWNPGVNYSLWNNDTHYYIGDWLGMFFFLFCLPQIWQIPTTVIDLTFEHFCRSVQQYCNLWSPFVFLLCSVLVCGFVQCSCTSQTRRM